MKTPRTRIRLSSALVCSILTLGLEGSTAGPRPKPVSAEAPETTFTDNVVINTGNEPSLTLNQNTSQGFAARTWDILGTENGVFIRDATAGTFPFRVLAGAPSVSLAVGSNGNVGVGTVAPAEALHIAKADTPTLRLEQSAGIFSAQIWDLRVNLAGLFIRNATDGGTTIPFLIAPTGNVGIGSTSPAGHLHVNGAGPQLSIFQSSNNDAVQFRLQTNSVNRRFVALNSAGAVQSQLLFGDNGAFDFLGPTVGVVRIKVLANGRVGIGTSTPDQMLSVNGNASKAGGGSWATFSDERLKDIKGEFKSGLDELMQLQPIRYEYKADNVVGLKSDGEHIGFGAEAVSKVIPEAVTRNEAGYLMIDNDPILWTMLNAIKEQNGQIQQQNKAMNEQAQLLKEQDEKINQLQMQNREIAELSAQLRRLQAEVVLKAETKKSSDRQEFARAHR